MSQDPRYVSWQRIPAIEASVAKNPAHAQQTPVAHRQPARTHIAKITYSQEDHIEQVVENMHSVRTVVESVKLSPESGDSPGRLDAGDTMEQKEFVRKKQERDREIQDIQSMLNQMLQQQSNMQQHRDQQRFEGKQQQQREAYQLKDQQQQREWQLIQHQQQMQQQQLLQKQQQQHQAQVIVTERRSPRKENKTQIKSIPPPPESGDGRGIQGCVVNATFSMQQVAGATTSIPEFNLNISPMATSTRHRPAQRSARSSTPRSKSTQPSATNFQEPEADHTDRKKFYDPADARRFMKEQRLKRRSKSVHQFTDPAVKSAHEKEMIKKRLQELRENTVKIMQKNMEKKKKKTVTIASATSTARSEATAKRPGMTQRSKSEMVIRKPSRGVNEPAAGGQGPTQKAEKAQIENQRSDQATQDGRDSSQRTAKESQGGAKQPLGNSGHSQGIPEPTRTVSDRSQQTPEHVQQNPNLGQPTDRPLDAEEPSQGTSEKDRHSQESPESHPVAEHTYPVQPTPQQKPLMENQKRVGLLRKPDTKDHSFSAIREFSFDKENVALEMLTPKVTYPVRQPAPEESKNADSVKSLESAVEDGESDLKRCNLEIPSAKLTSRNSLQYRGSSVTSDSARAGTCRSEDAREQERNFSQHRSELPFWLKPSTVQVYPYNFIMAVRRKLEAISNAQHSHDNCQHQNVGTETCNHQTTSTGDLVAAGYQRRDLETPLGRGAAATAEAQTHVRRRIIEECLKHASESEESMLTRTMDKRLPQKKSMQQRKDSVAEKPLEVAAPMESASEQLHNHSPDSQLKSQTYSELNSNLSSISVQLPPSNTVSEVSSIHTEVFPKSRSKTASRRSQRRPDDDTTASSSVLTSPEKKLKDDFKFLAPRPVSPLCLERVEQLKITSKSAEKGAEAVAGSKDGATEGDIDFSKLLDDFNRSLSQVIQVNEQLKSTLDKSHQIFSPTSSRPAAKKKTTSHSDEYSQDFEEETNQGAKPRSEDVQKALEQRLGDLLANVTKERAQSKGTITSLSPSKAEEVLSSPAASGTTTTRSPSKSRTPSKSIDEYTEDIEESSHHEKPSKSAEKRRRSHSLANKQITVYLTTSPPHQPRRHSDEASPGVATELDLKLSSVSGSRNTTVATETFTKTPTKSIDEYTEDIPEESSAKSFASHRRKLFGVTSTSQHEQRSIDDYTEEIAGEKANSEAVEEDIPIDDDEAPERFEQPLLLIEQMKASLSRAIKNSQANRSPPESKSERSVQFDEEQLSLLARKSKRSSKSASLSPSIGTSEAVDISPAPSTEIDGKEPSPNVGSRTFLVKGSPSSGSQSPAKSITEDLQNHRESPSEANERSPFTNSMSLSKKEKDESFIKSHINTSRGDFLVPEEFGGHRSELSGRSEDFTSNNTKDSSGKSKKPSETSNDFSAKSRDSSAKDKDFSGNSKDSSAKDKDFSGKSKDSSIKERDFSGNSKDSSVKERDFSGKSKDSSVKEREFSGKSKDSRDKSKDTSNTEKDYSGDSQDISGRSEYFSSKSKYAVGKSDEVSGNSVTLVEQLPTSGRRTAASATQLNDKASSTSIPDNVAPRRASSLTTSPRKSSKSLNISSFNQTDLDISLFSNVSDSSLNYSNVGLYEKLIRNETTKSEQLTALLKMREKALFDRTRGQIALLEVQKERYKAKGLVNQMAAVKKKQRAILLKMEREREELKRLLQSTSTTNSTESSHRSNHHPKDHHKSAVSSPRRHTKNRSPQPAALLPPPIPLAKSLRHTPPHSTHKSPEEAGPSGDLVRKPSSAPIVRATYALESSRPLEELLQKREADLQRRRAHVERLMQWHRRLDAEEAEVLQLEQMLLQYNCSQPPPLPPNDETRLDSKDLKGSASSNTTKDTTATLARSSKEEEEVTLAQSRLLLSEQELSPQEKRAAKMERRIKEIDRSLRKLSSISNTSAVPLSGSPGTSSVNAGEDSSPQDYVRTSGAKLNKLWRRLTSQQVEKFEPLQRYKLGKSDLERLYEEAKVAVLQDFAQNEERLAAELLEKSSTNLSQSESCRSLGGGGGERVNNVRVPLLNLSGSSAAPSDIDEDLLVGQAQGNYSPSAAEEDFQLRSQSKSSSDYSEDGGEKREANAAKFARNMQAFAALSQRVNAGQAGQLHRSLSDPSLQQIPLMLFTTTSNQNVYSGESRSTIKTDRASGSGSAPVTASVSGSGIASVSGSGSAPVSGSAKASVSGSGSGSFVSASGGATSYATTMDGVQSVRSEAPLTGSCPASSNIPSTRIDSASSSSGKASPTIASLASLSPREESLQSAQEAKESTSSGTLVHASEVKEVIESEEAKELTPSAAEVSASLPKSSRTQDSQISEKLQEISSALSELSQANSIPLPYQRSRSTIATSKEATTTPTTSKEEADAESDNSYSSNFENTTTEKQSPSGCTLKDSSRLSASQVIEEEADEVISGSGEKSLSPQSTKATMESSTPTKASKESRGDHYEADFESHADTSSINSANTTCIDDLSMPQFESSLETTQNGLPEADEEELKSPIKGGVKQTTNTLIEEGVTMLPLTPPPPPPPAPSFTNDTPRPNITSNSSNAQAVPDILNELEIRRCQQILIENEQQKQYEQVTAVPYIPYMREIPNKPPPPYVPPAHGSPMTTIFPSEERIKDITYRRAHELFCELIKTDYTNAKGEKLPSVMEEKITNIYERIILDICREYLAEHEEVLTRGDPSNFHSQLAFFNPPDRVRCVQESIYKEVRRCLAMDKTSPKRTQVYSVYGQRAKRDHIGKIIIQEMYDEDDRWCNFHREEHEVLDLIIEEMIGSNVEQIAKEVYVAEGGVLEEVEQNESSSDRLAAAEESTNGEVDTTNEELEGTSGEIEEKHEESMEAKEKENSEKDPKTESSELGEKSGAEQVSENIEESESPVKSLDAKPKETSPVRYYGCGGISLAEELRRANESLAITEPNNPDDSPISTTVVE